MINMFDIVEMKGCILNRAMKKPARDEKHVQKMMHSKRARIALAPFGMPVVSKMCPKTAPVLTPWCITMVAVTIDIPIIRPMERSVPVRRIRPATPSAKNIRGDACCRMFRMLETVSSCVCFTIGVMMHRKMKIATMTM